MKNNEVNSIIVDAEKYFGFLFDKGYKIRSAEYSSRLNGNWAVEIESPSCIIYITNDRNFLSLEFTSTKNVDIKSRITLEEIIYFLSKGHCIVAPFKGNLAWGKKKQFERLASLLKEYIDQIALYYEKIRLT